LIPEHHRITQMFRGRQADRYRENPLGVPVFIGGFYYRLMSIRVTDRSSAWPEGFSFVRVI
jgi:hypothetical protein